MKPFLKWAGNKYQIIDQIKSFLPEGKRLVEPFIGSGAVFLNSDYPRYLLTESNQDLVSLYQLLQKEGQKFITYAHQFFTPKNNNQKQYYQFRELFNTSSNQRLKAALFLYFNKHGYKGLCRYNNKGLFNVPYGYYKKPYFPTQEMIFFHQKTKRALFKQADFIKTMKQTKIGDIVYCDPPYVPLSDTAKFTNYSSGGFNQAQHEVLAKQAEQLAKRGITVIISNHDTKFTRDLYRNASLHPFSVPRKIGNQWTTKHRVGEILAVFR